MEKAKYDNEIDIALGKSRKDTHWKNTTWLWSQFIERLRQPVRTSETAAEYARMGKEMRDEKKDVGGFVGGHVADGRRKAGSVLNRSLLTLDMDYAAPDAWESVTLVLDNACAMYSTHSHTRKAPRYRLVLPLSREAAPDEYEAVGRYVAGLIGIDMFDDTTYQPERLMYWPSASKDGEYVCKVQDGRWLDVDEILQTYRNWRDTSEWPVSSRVDKCIRREIKKQGDPLEKEGVVGAFCRVYDIHQAIAQYLSDDYAECDNTPGRYTYLHGSTAAGLVTYEDKFAYSHHATDPSSGKLCNAFDLVRLHKFAHLDEGVPEKTNASKYPSYQAMEVLAGKDPEVRKTMIVERAASAKVDFDGVEVKVSDDVDMDWAKSLSCDKKGNVQSTRENVVLILEGDPNLKGMFAYDAFAGRPAMQRSPVWRMADDKDIYMRDDDEKNLRVYLESTYGIEGKQKIEDSLASVAMKKRYHPVRDYLKDLQWDGVPRLDTVFIDYMGVEDNELIRMATRISLTAAVARVMDPGCKYDYTVVLAGEQGVGKSRLLARLAVRPEWFDDGLSVEGRDKDAFETIQGKWIIEIAELAGFKKADMDTVKKFLTKTGDYYRAAYDRLAQYRKRQCVFFGTTNNIDFLRDATGDRRFWPMQVCRERITKSYDELTDDVVAQIWAEAKMRYEEGIKLYLSDELEARMDIERKGFTEDDGLSGIISDYLDTLLPVNWAEMDVHARRNWLAGDPLNAEGTVRRDKVCIAEIWCECLGKNLGDLDRMKSKGLREVMNKMPDWEHSRDKGCRFRGYGYQKYYTRKAETKSETRGGNERETIF